MKSIKDFACFSKENSMCPPMIPSYSASIICNSVSPRSMENCVSEIKYGKKWSLFFISTHFYTLFNSH